MPHVTPASLLPPYSEQVYICWEFLLKGLILKTDLNRLLLRLHARHGNAIMDYSIASENNGCHTKILWK